MTSTKVALREVQETSLVTLYGRALQSRWPSPILSDPWAEDAVGRLDYDFARLNVGARVASLMASRGLQLDLWTREFLALHQNAIVLHLGCGLDSRVFRVDPPPDASWFDVDFADVIELRRHLYRERAGYRAIASPLPELDWLVEVPTGRPTMIVAEGLLMYLPEDAIRQLLGRLIDHAGSGRLAFDSHPRALVRWVARRKWDVRGTGATFRWGLGAAEDVRMLDPRLSVIAERRAHELEGLRRAPRSARALVRAMDVVPALRIMRCVLCGFPADPAAHTRSQR